MAQPFAAETWTRRGDVPPLLLNGVYSGIVGSPIHAVYDAKSRTVQSFAQRAHHFNGFANTAQISFDDGVTWATSFNEAQNVALNEFAMTGWSMPNPSGVGMIHFQVRMAWIHATASSSGAILSPGGISLWASAGGSTFSKLQDLHTWPAINEIGGARGSFAAFTLEPFATNPILLEGSGPDGEDAYWFVSSYGFDAGGAGNPTTFSAATLWRSIDGGISWENVRDMAPVVGTIFFSQIVKSTSGRLIIVGGGGGPIQWTDGDLLTGSFTDSIFNGVSGVRGPLMEMYGGTLFTFSQGTLTGNGASWISCDNAENFGLSGDLIPQNHGGFGAKLGPTELLVVAPSFSNPVTETCAYYSANGGEDFVISEPWLVSGTGELPVSLDIRTNGTPIVVCRGGGVFSSSDKARGVAGTRTQCPLANAGLAPARRLILCGGVITPDCQE